MGRKAGSGAVAPDPVSFWLETCGDEMKVRPAAVGSIRCDVAIVGGGFTGLWTAYYLLKNVPGLRVAIFESRYCGVGASGRTAAGAGARVAGQAQLEAECSPGLRSALWVEQLKSIDELGKVAESEAFDIEWERVGSLAVALGRGQREALGAAERALTGSERARGVRLMPADELRSRISTAHAEGAIWDPAAASVHPGKLVRGLARATERRGAKIYENSEVQSVGVTRTGAVARLDAAEVHARRVVLAAEGYLPSIQPVRRHIAPIASSVVLTESLGPKVWEEIGWEGRELLHSFRLSVNYLRRTSDGRILVGGRGAPYRFGSRVSQSCNDSSVVYRELRGLAARWFPALRSAGFTHQWSGVLGAGRGLRPGVHVLSRGRILAVGGYVGTGVAPSNMLGRLCANVVLDRKAPLVESPLVIQGWRKWEPEPLRWLGIRYVQVRLNQLDRAAEAHGKAPSGRTLAERLWRG